MEEQEKNPVIASLQTSVRSLVKMMSSAVVLWVLPAITIILQWFPRVVYILFVSHTFFRTLRVVMKLRWPFQKMGCRWAWLSGPPRRNWQAVPCSLTCWWRIVPLSSTLDRSESHSSPSQKDTPSSTILAWKTRSEALRDQQANPNAR